jgi:PAS domain S-box-containing protein
MPKNGNDMAHSEDYDSGGAKPVRTPKRTLWCSADREELLAAIVDSSTDAIISEDLDGVIQSWNKGAEQIFGYAAEESIGQPITILAVPDQPLETPGILARIRNGERVTSYDTIRRAKDGKIIAVSLTVSPIRNSEGEIVGASKIARDITAQKRAEQRQRESEARFRTATAAVSSLIWTNNAAGEMAGEQPGWAAFTGQSYEEYQGYGWANAVHPDDAQKTIDTWNAAVEAKAMFVFEHRVRRRDGVYRLFNVRALPVLEEQGSIREWVGVHTDITEERQLTEERTAALSREHQARQTAELLNQVGRSLTTELDTQVLTQKITDLATQLVGAEFGSLFHNIVDDKGESYLLYTISGVPRERFSRFPMPRNTKVFAPTFAGEAIVRSDDITKDPRYGQNAPYHGMPEGHLPVKSYLAAPVISRSGAVLGGLFFGHQKFGVFTLQHEELLGGIASQAAIALDNARLFAESQRARDAFARTNSELQRANADLEHFAYSASHDLRAPLRQIIVFHELLQSRYEAELDVGALELVRLSVEGAKRMEALISGLLEYTRAVIAGNVAVKPIAARAVLDQAVENLRTAITETSAEIECSDLPELEVQEVHLLQLFQNLLGNALKYRGESPPKVRVYAVQENSHWKLGLADNGIGISANYLVSIFDLFKRLHTNEEYSGSGIGLALCQKIVERYGGRIWAESEGPGKGATFWFTLPGPSNFGV